ncbi:molybdopterin-guanine dinucleotide biosynthesis protein B [uncultured Desulfuromonas sp.]|uniref:molybdopterin-guanine dinucleotide biosynthesis protein B n=1 Tax=uncultured Desulfuromonas sp. TaxID=181013 RepID=UPI002AAB4961|nr:molybdopterin-guanine dinucleotide biosynthesis protein B [uncultured Desulfuromonas sp.]
MTQPVLCALSGWSGSGKTTLACAIVRYLERRHRMRVGVIKHDGHRFPVDVSGTDTCRLAEAGAVRTVLCGEDGLVVRETAPPSCVTALIERFGADLDVLLLEGFKNADVDKIEVYRSSLGKAPLFTHPDRYPRVVAVATDTPLADDAAPQQLDLNCPEQIAEFILKRNDTALKVSA